MTLRHAIPILGLAGLAAGAACAAGAGAGADDRRRAVVRVTGSDTMVNLVQAWAERYRAVRPDVTVQVAGGGTGVGVVALMAGLCEVAAASRELTAEERAPMADAHEFTVALDALAVYVHAGNPLDAIALSDLAEVYGEGGRVHRWSELGARVSGCRRDRIARVGRQNSSGTFAYFRDVVLGPGREYALGSIDQSGSKDVVALVARTPCAIGYSGMAYASPGVKALRLARRGGELGVAPSAGTALDGSYPLARRLYLYTATAPAGETRQFIDWVQSPAAQALARELGFVPAAQAVRP